MLAAPYGGIGFTLLFCTEMYAIAAILLFMGIVIVLIGDYTK